MPHSKKLTQYELINLVRSAYKSATPEIQHEADLCSVSPENSVTVTFLTVDDGVIDALIRSSLIELSKIGFSHDIPSYASNSAGDLVKISIEDAKTVKFVIKNA